MRNYSGLGAGSVTVNVAPRPSPSLAAVTVVPAPNNPATGQPFVYTLDAAAGTATLDVPPLGNMTPQQDGKRYVIRLKAK